MAFATSEGVWHPAPERFCSSGARAVCGRPRSQTVLKSKASPRTSVSKTTRAECTGMPGTPSGSTRPAAGWRERWQLQAPGRGRCPFQPQLASAGSPLPLPGRWGPSLVGEQTARDHRAAARSRVSAATRADNGEMAASGRCFPGAIVVSSRAGGDARSCQGRDGGQANGEDRRQLAGSRRARWMRCSGTQSGPRTTSGGCSENRLRAVSPPAPLKRPAEAGPHRCAS